MADHQETPGVAGKGLDTDGCVTQMPFSGRVSKRGTANARGDKNGEWIVEKKLLPIRHYTKRQFLILIIITYAVRPEQ